MMAHVTTKTIRDRWIAAAVAAGALGLFLLAGMAVYRDIDLSIYADLPRSVRDLMGFGDAISAAGLAYGAIYGTVGALVLAGIAISMGSSAIAGEERAGTLALLLANPRSRGYIAVRKAVAMVLLTAAAALVLWGAGRLAPAVLDVELTGFDVGALVAHMLANALFYGFLALAIGAATGNAGAASAIAAAVMVVSFLAVGILPLVGGLEDVAKAFPWYYYVGSDPVRTGIDWAHLAVLLGGSAAFGAAALAGLRRRDLKGSSAGESLLDRLRANPLTQAAAERLAGAARVSRIATKAASERQGLLVVCGLILLVLGVTMGPLYTAIDADLKTLTDDLPEALLALVGGADMGTPEGWYQAESFSLMVPIALIAVGIVAGAAALAGEERRRTMGLLLANPVSRSRVVGEKAAAMAAQLVLLGIVTFAGTVLGSLLGGLGISVAGIAAASALGTLLAIVFGALALALGAATGRTQIATYGAAGVAFASYLLDSLLPLSDSLAGLAKLSPFHYYLSSDPLANGMQWGHAALLAALAGGLTVLATVLFQRRDLRR